MKRILIVEDDTSILEILSESLGQEGYEIKKVVSASEALEAAKTFQPHLVLTDNDMPEMSGLDMLRELRRQKNYVTVIFVSGRTDTNFVVEALRAGADDYIRKPFRINELSARIESALRTNEVHRELLEANLRLQDMIDHDHLTGLFNMRSMYEKIEVEIKRAKRFQRQMACVMMDMDHFKSVNDNHDHLFGSYVLKAVGQLIKANIREVDFAARYGGDEFLVVLTETSKEGAGIFCERVRKAISAEPITDGKDSIALTVSLGYAIGGDTFDLDARTLVRQADQALYRAKETGRNRAVAFQAGDVKK
jgi:two-component system, cell cycle response regulator